jgi:hypothetical protein
MSTNSVIDFTRASVNDSAGAQPVRPGVYKFMLISEADSTHLVLGPVSEFAYHASLVDSFCARRGLASAWVKKPDLVEVYAAQVRLLGGGWMKVHSDGGGIDIYGRSTAYGRFKEDAVRDIASTDPFFAGTTVRIESSPD